MALELQLETLEGVDEGLKGLYVENDGKFTLDVNGGIPDVTTLEGTLVKVRDELKASKAQAKEELDKFKDVDLDAIEEMRKKSEVLEADRVKAEEQKLLDENNAEQVWANRTDKLKTEFEKQLDAEKANTAKEQTVIKTLKQRALQGEIGLGINGIFHDHAQDDAISAAEKLFSLNDNGKAVMIDVDGNVIIGKDGKTPFSPAEWAKSDDLRTTKPHWFLATGSGAGMTQGITPSARNKATEGMSAVDRLTLARSQKK